MGGKLSKAREELDAATTLDDLNPVVAAIFKRRLVLYSIIFAFEVATLINYGVSSGGTDTNGTAHALAVLPLIFPVVTAITIVTCVPLVFAPAAEWKALLAAGGFAVRALTGVVNVLLVVIGIAQGVYSTDHWWSLLVGPVLVTLMAGVYVPLCLKVRAALQRVAGGGTGADGWDGEQAGQQMQPPAQAGQYYAQQPAGPYQYGNQQ